MTVLTHIDVSVIIPAWRAASFIGRAVASALASEGVAVEVIVVDDASSDSTFETIQSLAAGDPRIRAERLPANQGPSAARNHAISLAQGRYIAILDADDAINVDRLRRLAALGDASGADIIVDNMISVTEQGRADGGEPFLTSDDFGVACEIDLETWIRFNQPMKPGDCLGYLKPLFRRTTLERLGVRYDARLRNSEDYYLVAELLAAGARMTFTPSTGYLYTRSPASTSHRLAPSHTDAWLVAEAAFQARHADKLAAREREALAGRMRQLRDVRQFVHAVEALKTRRIGALAKTLASDPAAWPFTLGWFARIAMDKASGRKAA